jgi:hypothetical protein
LGWKIDIDLALLDVGFADGENLHVALGLAWFAPPPGSKLHGGGGIRWFGLTQLWVG